MVTLKVSDLLTKVPIAKEPSAVSLPLKINLKEVLGFLLKKSFNTKEAWDWLYTPSTPKTFNKILSFPYSTIPTASFDENADSISE